jgi:hypothetical protein
LDAYGYKSRRFVGRLEPIIAFSETDSMFN